MSEAELHILKARMHEGRRAKAARGELVMGLPRGYVLHPSGEVALDPDEQVRATIRLVFDLFERRRSIRGVLVFLADHAPPPGLCGRLRLRPAPDGAPGCSARQAAQRPTVHPRTGAVGRAAPQSLAGLH